MANRILKYKKSILIIIGMIAISSAAMMLNVQINYDLTDFLPENVPSSIALKELEESFTDDIPNLNVYIRGINLPNALIAKERLLNLSGVSSVLWLDDVADIYYPLSTIDHKTVSSWYRDEGALFLVSGDTDRSTEIVEQIKDSFGKDVTLSGPLLNQATIQTLTTGEVSKIIFYIVPLILLVLFISTSSWFEPLLFLITIGVAILINEGTNVFIGEISYVTQSTSAVLQLAVSMDYAVFLLHSFSRFREKGEMVEVAMKHAMRESAPAVAASATTTVFGFLALTLMKFKLGPNMGMVLAKGILFSFLSVMILLPILAVYSTRIMDKTHHSSFIPSFQGFSKVVLKICVPLSLIFMLIIIPNFMAQKNNSFIYGSSGIHNEDSQLWKDAEEINRLFGQKQQMVIILPDGDISKEKFLSDALKNLPLIDDVISYPLTVGIQVPTGFMPENQLKIFQSGDKKRIILYGNVSEEGEESFALVEEIRSICKDLYGNDYHLLGQCVVNYDLKDTIVKDGPLVNGAAIIAIGLVLLITFRNLILPFILLLTIEGAVWINLGMPYFIGSNLNYIGFLIISSVQLGATVDYGILFANNYMRMRKDQSSRDAARLTIKNTAASIITPAIILAIACLILWFVSTNGIISELGLMLGRGAIISATMVLLFLPALLIIFDKAIRKTTWSERTLFHLKKNKEVEPHESP
ncbi:MAG: efflux RND transporter permease subunit [Anaerovoracaceae bacterium]|jgi:predicted RND superfamily exporter protein